MIKRALGTALAVGALVFWALAAQAADYRIDSAHSFVQFKISHLGYAWMIGTFERVSGSFTFDPDAGPEGQTVWVKSTRPASIQITPNATSICVRQTS